MMAHAQRKVLRKVFEYDQPPEVVWHALTDAREMDKWLEKARNGEI